MLHIEQIKANINDFNYSFLICSDFNARVGELKDFVSSDNNRYIDPLSDDYISDTNIRRLTQDGYNLVDFCRHTGLRIANGRIGEDVEVGKCTCVGSAETSLIN